MIREKGHCQSQGRGRSGRQLKKCGLTSTLRQRKGRAPPTIHHLIPSRENAMPAGPKGGVVGGYDGNTYMTPQGRPDFVALGLKNNKHACCVGVTV